MPVFMWQKNRVQPRVLMNAKKRPIFSLHWVGLLKQRYSDHIQPKGRSNSPLDDGGRRRMGGGGGLCKGDPCSPWHWWLSTQTN